MALGYRYTLETQENGWTLVRFPGIPEDLTEGASEAEAGANALDCVIAALEGYMRAGPPLPRSGAGQPRTLRPAIVGGGAVPSVLKLSEGDPQTFTVEAW
jgi:hypothetical protein